MTRFHALAIQGSFSPLNRRAPTNTFSAFPWEYTNAPPQVCGLPFA